MSRNGLNGLHVLFAANPCSVQLDDAPGLIDEQIAAIGFAASHAGLIEKAAMPQHIAERLAFP